MEKAIERVLWDIFFNGNTSKREVSMRILSDLLQAMRVFRETCIYGNYKGIFSVKWRNNLVIVDGGRMQRQPYVRNNSCDISSTANRYTHNRYNETQTLSISTINYIDNATNFDRRVSKFFP